MTQTKQPPTNPGRFTPFLVITQEAFVEFDPAQHDWRIILLASAVRPGNSIPQLFQVMGQAIVQNRSVFEYLDRVKGTAGESDFGQIIGPGDDLAEPSPAKLGRPSLLDPKWDVLGRIARAIEAKDWSEENKLNKMVIAKLVRRHLNRQRPDFTFDAKSIVTALDRKGLWGQYDEQVTRLKRR